MTALHGWLQIAVDLVVLVVIVKLYRRIARAIVEFNRPRSPRDGGIPKGIIPPRSHLECHHSRIAPGLHWSLRHTPFRDVEARFAGDAMQVKWVRWQWTLCAFTHCVWLEWWTERERLA